MSEKKAKAVKISPVKGRPMLHWVGKQPPSVGRYYPPLLCERVGVANPASPPDFKSFMDGKAGHNLLFHGDNKEVLTSLLVGGFRGKVDLVYIDPPFDSGADYVRKVQLRGEKAQMQGAGHSLGEQVQYEDIWANDNYLQFMYERLILLRELLSERGSIYLHCDWHKSHHLRFLLDEIFGPENFRNHIIWHYYNKFSAASLCLPRSHDDILFYSKKKDIILNQIRETRDKPVKQIVREGVGGVLKNVKDENGNLVYRISHDKKTDDVWRIPQLQPASAEWTGYATQKHHDLLERIISMSSNPGSIVLDCFCGSGTTAAVAEKLGRRWIVADMNKGAIQTTMKRVGKIINGGNGGNGYKTIDSRRGFAHYRVNNYDFAEESVLRELVVNKYNIEKITGFDKFFDGTLGGELVRIAKLNKPLEAADVKSVRDELAVRGEVRDVVLIGNGCEVGLQAEMAKGDKQRAINKIHIIDLQQSNLVARKLPEAKVQIAKSGKTATVKITDYINPLIAEKLQSEGELLQAKIADFRAMIDRVLFDTDYDDKCFNIVSHDTPDNKTDLIRGEYTLALPRPGAKVAVKIIDMLGEETTIVK